jgi:hypothetical protein
LRHASGVGIRWTNPRDSWAVLNSHLLHEKVILLSHSHRPLLALDASQRTMMQSGHWRALLSHERQPMRSITSLHATDGVSLDSLSPSTLLATSMTALRELVICASNRSSSLAATLHLLPELTSLQLVQLGVGSQSNINWRASLTNLRHLGLRGWVGEQHTDSSGHALFASLVVALAAAVRCDGALGQCTLRFRAPSAIVDNV